MYQPRIVICRFIREKATYWKHAETNRRSGGPIGGGGCPRPPLVPFKSATALTWRCGILALPGSMTSLHLMYMVLRNTYQRRHSLRRHRWKVHVRVVCARGSVNAAAESEESEINDRRTWCRVRPDLKRCCRRPTRHWLGRIRRAIMRFSRAAHRAGRCSRANLQWMGRFIKLVVVAAAAAAPVSD